MDKEQCHFKKEGDHLECIRCGCRHHLNKSMDEILNAISQKKKCEGEKNVGTK